MKTQVCIRCGHRLDIAENQPKPEAMVNRAFAEAYCARCLELRTRQEPIVAKVS